MTFVEDDGRLESIHDIGAGINVKNSSRSSLLDCAEIYCSWVRMTGPVWLID